MTNQLPPLLLSTGIITKEYDTVAEIVYVANNGSDMEYIRIEATGWDDQSAELLLPIVSNDYQPVYDLFYLPANSVAALTVDVSSVSKYTIKLTKSNPQTVSVSIVKGTNAQVVANVTVVPAVNQPVASVTGSTAQPTANIAMVPSSTSSTGNLVPTYYPTNTFSAGTTTPYALPYAFSQSNMTPAAAPVAMATSYTDPQMFTSNPAMYANSSAMMNNLVSFAAYSGVVSNMMETAFKKAYEAYSENSQSYNSNNSSQNGNQNGYENSNGYSSENGNNNSNNNNNNSNNNNSNGYSNSNN